MSESPVTLDPGSLGARELAALVEASAMINASLDVSETLHAIARAAAGVLDAEAASVLLRDQRRGRLVFEAAYGESGEALLGQEMSAELGIAGKVISSGQAVLVGNVRNDPAFYPGFDDRSSFVTRGIVAAPMRRDGEVVGVVEVLNRREGEFGPRDRDLLQIFANLAASAALNAQRHASVERENRGLREAVLRYDPIIGGSDAWLHAMAMCERVARTNSTVLITGETGVGKEVCARAIHARSDRARRAFVAVNCAALPETLLESELFGHEAGAFTGATAQRQGRFELADGGTLFLDEIGDISASTQIKLLRVLQEREFVRVGGTRPISCDVRILAATNRDLKAAMRDAEFREDLFYRLNVFPITAPPLRERAEDIPLLVEHFVSRSAVELGVRATRVSDEAMALLCAYRWPGNVRELRNVIERSVLLCDGTTILPGLLPPEILGETPAATVGGGSVEAYERSLLVRTLREYDWNQTHAAKALNMTRDNLRYRLKKYNIKRPDKQ